jgi:hypothetical protein
MTAKIDPEQKYDRDRDASRQVLALSIFGSKTMISGQGDCRFSSF